MDLLAFLLIATGIIIVPGPNVMAIVSTSIIHGKIRGLQTVAGTSMAMSIQLITAAIATSWFLHLLSNGLFWLKIIGVTYLLYLGLLHLLKAISPESETPVLSGVGSFQRGFWISLTNPKTILFFSAFLPQFVDPLQSYPLQIALLSGIFLILAIVLDSGYALLSSRIADFLKNRIVPGYRHAASGIIFTGAAITLATKNTQ